MENNTYGCGSYGASSYNANTCEVGVPNTGSGNFLSNASPQAISGLVIGTLLIVASIWLLARSLRRRNQKV